MMNRADLVLLFGATGKSGFHVANALIDRGFAVRIVVRSKAKVAQMFKQKQISFEKIIQGSLASSETLAEAFDPSEIYGKVKFAVSALGIGMGSKESVEEVQYLSQVRIIEKCKEVGVQKYIFITACLMERPWNKFAVLLNTLVPGIYHWKAKAQNHLRKSGINYAIVRPPGLEGDEKNTTVTNYALDQGDRISGRITRCTLGNIIRDVIDSKDIPDKVTFECMGIDKDTKNPPTLTFGQLKPDTEASIVKADHKTPKYVYGLTLLTLIASGVYLVATRFFNT